MYLNVKKVIMEIQILILVSNVQTLVKPVLLVIINHVLNVNLNSSI